MCKVTTFSINLLSFMLVFMYYCIISVCAYARGAEGGRNESRNRQKEGLCGEWSSGGVLLFTHTRKIISKSKLKNKIRIVFFWWIN